MSLLLKFNNSTYNFLYRTYAFKSDLKIKWVRPEKIPHYKPARSGDLQGLPNIDRTLIRPEFRNSKELQTADELVKKLFTLEFAPKHCTNKVYQENLISQVRQHEFDADSCEAKIARATAIIRSMQAWIDKYPLQKKTKVYLQELVHRRNKRLKFLRKDDYKRFEWLLEELQIVYKPAPQECTQVTRKSSLRKLTDIYCDNVKAEQLAKYRLQLENEKPLFLEDKIRCLEFIRNEQKECGEEVTISQEEIDNARKQLKELVRQQEEEKSKNIEE